MRIGYVLKKFPRLSETFILNEVLGLEKAGHHVEVIALHDPDDEPLHAEFGSLRATIHRLHPESDRLQPKPGGTAGETLLTAIEALPGGKGRKRIGQGVALAQLARDLELDHLHAHFMTVAAQVAAVARLAGGPTFTVTAHAKDIFRTTVSPAVFASIVALSSGLVTVTNFNREFIAGRYLQGDASRIHRIYNGLPLADPSFAPHASESRDSDLLVGVGRLVEKKGFEHLIGAVEVLRSRGRHLRCVIIGDGEEREALEGLVEELSLGDSVTLTGALPRETAMDWMRHATIFVLPCRTGLDGNRDALPTVLIEAMALGTPIVSTRLNGVPEIVEHGHQGLLVEEGETTEVADAVERMLDDDALRADMSRLGPQRARALFDRDQTLPMLIDLFQRAGSEPA